MFRSLIVEHVIADDSTLKQPVFGPRKASMYQTRDLEVFSTVIRVGPSDSDTQVAIAPVTTGYNLVMYSDYPIRFRVNGSGATQFTMRSNNVAPVNQGAPLPDQCVVVMPVEVTSLYVQPIASAAQTANVRIAITGDPTSAYT